MGWMVVVVCFVCLWVLLMFVLVVSVMFMCCFVKFFGLLNRCRFVFGIVSVLCMFLNVILCLLSLLQIIVDVVGVLSVGFIGSLRIVCVCSLNFDWCCEVSVMRFVLCGCGFILENQMLLLCMNSLMLNILCLLSVLVILCVILCDFVSVVVCIGCGCYDLIQLFVICMWLIGLQKQVCVLSVVGLIVCMVSCVILQLKLMKFLMIMWLWFMCLFVIVWFYVGFMLVLVFMIDCFLFDDDIMGFMMYGMLIFVMVVLKVLNELVNVYGDVGRLSFLVVSWWIFL